MLSADLKETFLSLVRLGIGHGATPQLCSVDWTSVKKLADRHGLSAVVLDGLNEVLESNYRLSSLNSQFKLSWIGEVMQSYEVRYQSYEKAISSFAGWHNSHGFKMMVLKGYACALYWPKPNHRPCGDIDIWQFGEQKEADVALAKEKDIKIDSSHHHHTVYAWNGFTVENHYDFLNVHHHKSNVELESILKELGKDDSNYVELYGEKVFMPSPNLHALFLLRHSMSNFASTGMRLRQLLDWAFLIESQGKDINWKWLEKQLDYFGMKKLYDAFNVICVEDLGFDVKLFPQVQFQPELKDRVLNDILTPEFSEKESGGFVSRAVFKYRRWKANKWKHELCFNDSLWSAFWSGVWGHLMKPGMI